MADQNIAVGIIKIVYYICTNKTKNERVNTKSNLSTNTNVGMVLGRRRAKSSSNLILHRNGSCIRTNIHKNKKMKLTKTEIWEIQSILRKEREIMEQKSIEWAGDDEDDKSISLMCDNKANQITCLIDKLDEILKYNELTKSVNNFNQSINSDNNISDDFKNLFI